MPGRVQPQKSFGDEALEPHVSDSHFLAKAGISEEPFAAVLAQVETAGIMVKRPPGECDHCPVGTEVPPKGETSADLDTSWTVKNGKPKAHGFNSHCSRRRQPNRVGHRSDHSRE